MNAAGLLLLQQRENAPLLTHPNVPKNLRAFWDPIGSVWTIGYGHTGPYPQGLDDPLVARVTWSHVSKNDQLTDEGSARAILDADVAIREQRLLPKLPQGLNDNQRAALTLLAYNAGVPAILNSHLLRTLRGYAMQTGVSLDQTALRLAWLQWDHGEVDGKEQEIAGLKARREAEWALFVTPATMEAPHA
jgi:GH24 family phage-related lysozyme (muramidase)